MSNSQSLPRARTDDSRSGKCWLFRHWMRTSGIQCCRGQPGIDQIIPIYWPEDPSSKSPSSPEERMSVLMVSNKATITKNEAQLNRISPGHPSLQCDTGRPSVAILLDVGLEASSFSSRYQQSQGHRCWRIYASAMDHQTFPKVDAGVVDTLHTMLHQLKPQDANLPKVRAVTAATFFGRTSGASYMDWDADTTVLDMNETILLRPGRQ